MSRASRLFVMTFELTHATGFASSLQVTGKLYAFDMASPTPSILTTGVSDMETA
jgi:hypothetical protein